MLSVARFGGVYMPMKDPAAVSGAVVAVGVVAAMTVPTATHGPPARAAPVRGEKPAGTSYDFDP
jgi:hypothetical protein